MKPLFLLIIVLFLSACSGPPLKPELRELSRISIRNQQGHPEFYEKTSGKRFVPQGVNWVQLAKSNEKWPANISFNDDYFSSHSSEIKSSLKEIGKLGYNVVRIRIDAKGITGPRDRVELNPRYVRNLIQFIRAANDEKLYVLLTGQWLPENYYQLDSHIQDQTSGINQLLLSKGLIHAFAQYEADLIRTIKSEAPELLKGIFAFDLWNEQSFSAKDLPFSKTTGIFVANGEKKYYLSNASSRQKLADDSTLRWVNEVALEIKSVEPELLITSSVFTPLEVRRKEYDGVYVSGSEWGDWRQPFRLTMLEKSKLDFLQIHPYPHSLAYKIDDDLKSLEFFRLKRTKPILIGEFGVHKKDFPSFDSALPAIKSYLDQACGHQFAGWIFWTWDTYQQNRADDLWNMTDHDSKIAKVLSPNTLNWCPNSENNNKKIK